MDVTYYYRSDPTRQLLQVGANVKNLKVGDWVVPIKTPFGKLSCSVTAYPAVRWYCSVPVDWHVTYLFAFLTTCYITGTWRQHGKAEESALVKVPNDIPAAYAATLTINPTTAYCLLREFEKLQPGDVIIQVSNGTTAHCSSRSLFEGCYHALKVAFTNATFNFMCLMLTEWGRTVLWGHYCCALKMHTVNAMLIAPVCGGCRYRTARTASWAKWWCRWRERWASRPSTSCVPTGEPEHAPLLCPAADAVCRDCTADENALGRSAVLNAACSAQLLHSLPPLTYAAVCRSKFSLPRVMACC
jgi:hypothetical protein